MDDGTALLRAVPYYLFILPISAILRALLTILSPLYYALQFVLLPFIYLARFAWRAIVFPFVMLAKLEVSPIPCAPSPPVSHLIAPSDSICLSWRRGDCWRDNRRHPLLQLQSAEVCLQP